MRELLFFLALTIGLVPVFSYALDNKVEKKDKARISYFVKSKDGSYVQIKPPPKATWPPNPKCECEIYTKSRWQCVTSKKASAPHFENLPAICFDEARNLLIKTE